MSNEAKAKKIIQDSIDKRLVAAYISKLNTSKEIYDRLVSLFKVSDANQVLFLKNKLKDIKKGKDEDIQSYFLRITEIKNDLLSIGEVIPDKELTITTLGGLPSEWCIFKTTILNNDQTPRFEELMSRCIQEDTRMVEQEMPSSKGNPIAFSSHAKRRNNSGSQGHFKGKPRSKGGRKGRCFVCNKFGHYARECPNKKDTSHDDDQNHSRGNSNNNQRNGRFNGKGKRNAGNQGNGQSSKKARNSKYESNVVNNKQDEYYLISALSTTSPPDSLGNCLIDSGASRHFTGYKEALSTLIEKETNLEIILGDNCTFPVKGAQNVTLQFNQGNTIHCKKSYMYLISRRTWCPFRQWKTKATRWNSSMARYVFGKRILKMLSLLGSELTLYIKLEEVCWESCLATHLYSLNYGPDSLPTFIKRFYRM